MVPWLHRFTNEQGFHQLCCTGTGKLNQLRDAEGNPLRVDQGLTDAEFLNSPDLKAVRAGMLKGEWPGACDRCRNAEEARAISIRQHSNNRFRHWIEDSLGKTAEDGTLSEPRVRFADIRLGNVCNLTCRMCGPGASRLWADHYNEVQPRRFIMPQDELSYLRDHNWVKSRPVQWLIEQCLPTVESLHFAGGEPLIIPEMVELLETCVRAGRADQIDLSYNTNITVLPEKVTRLWHHFRNVNIMCSIDAFGSLNDYIRRPAKWKDIDRNLHILDDHYEEWHLRTVHCNTTVQVYNILQISELFDYLGDTFKSLNPAPYLTPLYNPSYLSISILPDAIKAVAEERLLAAESRALARFGPRAAITSVHAVIAHMKNKRERIDLMDFLYFSEKTDREFGESWRQACPELSQMLSARS